MRRFFIAYQQCWLELEADCFHVSRTYFDRISSSVRSVWAGQVVVGSRLSRGAIGSRGPAAAKWEIGGSRRSANSWLSGRSSPASLSSGAAICHKYYGSLKVASGLARGDKYQRAGIAAAPARASFSARTRTAAIASASSA